MNYAKYDFVGSMSWQMHNWMGVVIIGWLLSQAAVGAYEVAWRVASVVTLLSTAVATSVFPQISAWNAEAATDRIEELLYASLTPALILIVPAIFGVAVLAREILAIVFGTEYTIAWLVLIVLTTGKIAEGIKQVVSKSLHGLDQPALVARATVIAGVLNVVLNVILVYQFGLVGAAIATVVSYTVGAVLRIRYLSALITVRVPYQEIGWCVLSAAVMTAVIVQVRTVFGVNTLTELGVIVTTGAIVYTVMVLTYGRLRRRALRTAHGLMT